LSTQYQSQYTAKGITIAHPLPYTHQWYEPPKNKGSPTLDETMRIRYELQLTHLGKPTTTVNAGGDI